MMLIMKMKERRKKREEKEKKRENERGDDQPTSLANFLFFCDVFFFLLLQLSQGLQHSIALSVTVNNNNKLRHFSSLTRRRLIIKASRLLR